MTDLPTGPPIPGEDMSEFLSRTQPMRERTQWWLATVSDSHGITKLTDGPHDSREGVEQAAYLMRALGLQHGDKYAAAEVRLTEVTPKAHEVNHEAIAACNEMMR